MRFLEEKWIKCNQENNHLGVSSGDPLKGTGCFDQLYLKDNSFLENMKILERTPTVISNLYLDTQELEIDDETL